MFSTIRKHLTIHKYGSLVRNNSAIFDGESGKIYAKIAEQHRHPNGPWNMILKKIKSIRIPVDAKVVDLASGPGEPAITIATHVPSATVFSTDISLEMHKMSAAKAITISNLKSMIADAQDLSVFDSNSVDIVTCCYGYMFPEDKKKALRESYRILKPGGVLIATYWRNLDMLKLTNDIMRTVLGQEPPPPPMNPMSLSVPGLFEDLIKSAGFNHECEYIESCYPFSLGTDPEFQYRIVTLVVKPKLDELQAHVIAKKAFNDYVQNYTTIDSKTGSRVIPNNVFVMATVVK